MAESTEQGKIQEANVAEILSGAGALHNRASNLAAQLHSVSSNSQNLASGTVVTGASPRILAIANRYRDAYLVARATVGFGSVIKIIGVVLAALIFLGGFIIAGAAADAAGKNGGAIFIAVLIVIGGFGGFIGVLLYLQGILVSAQGQTLKASLDSAVNNSPFIDNDQKAAIMSLPAA